MFPGKFHRRLFFESNREGTGTVPLKKWERRLWGNILASLKLWEGVWTMKNKIRKFAAYVLSLCMVLGMVWLPAKAAAADGVIDTSQEGYEIVRYYTGTETEISSAQTKNERLSDFILGTESMEWSVDFKTTGTKLQALLALNTSDKYYVLYIKSGAVAFEVRGGQTVKQSESTSYADGQWHTVTLRLKKNGKITLTIDGTESASADTESGSLISGWTPTAFTIGGVTGYGTESQTAGWTFSGSMRNVVLKKAVAAPTSEPVYQVANPEAGTVSTGIESALATGSINLTYRLKEAASARVSVLGIGSQGEIYVDPASRKAGVRLGDANAEFPVSNVDLGTEKWHNLAVTLGGGELCVYVDGEAAGTVEFTGTADVSEITCSDSVYYSKAVIYEMALTQERVAELHQATESSRYPDGTEKLEGYNKTENREIFNSGFDGSVAYRIPAIVTSRKTGTVIASIDKRWNHSGDVGKIDTVIRRSEDNGATWGPVIPVIDMPDADAYTVDPAMVVDNQEDSPYYGRIYLLVDMYPYDIGLWASRPGTGYKEVNGVQCRVLYDSDNREYTVRENGIVYDSEGNKTEYQVETEAKAPYKEQGSLYKNGVKIGSIYKNSELKIYETTYLWMSYSDDDGLTWSVPKDITPMVKDDWMRFSGTGPGQGVQLQNGRIVFSAYCSNARVDSIGASALSSFHVYTDDGGETWHRGASPNDISETQDASNSSRQLNENSIVQLNNGHMIQFMKNATNQVAMAISTDNGASWGEVTYASGITEPYCNLSAIHYPEKIVDPRDGEAKEAIIFANPRGTTKFTTNGREGGTVRIAFVNEDDTLDWAYSKLIEENKFLYCSLTVMNNGDIGMIYEHEGYATVGAAFTSFSPEYIMDGNTYENTPAPVNITASIVDADGQETDILTAGSRIDVDVTFSQNVFAAGNVTLNLQVGDETREAALVGNVSEKVLRFSYIIRKEDAGKVKVTGEVNVKEDGAAETIYNVSLTDKPIVTKDITVGRIAADASGDGFYELPVDGMSATAGSEYGGTSEGPASNVLDGNLSTHWHSNYPTDNVSNGGRSKHWITISLGGPKLVSALEYTPRTGGLNGCVTRYQIEVSTDGTNFQPVAQGEWLKTSDVKTAEFYGPVAASYVKLRVLDTGDEWATAAEIRIIGNTNSGAVADRTELIAELMKYAEYEERLLEQYPAFAAAIGDARRVASDIAFGQSEVEEALAALRDAAAGALSDIRAALPAAIGAAEGKNQEEYNISSWAEYHAAIETAKNVTDSAEVSEVLDAYLALADAEANLVGSKAGLVNRKEALAAVIAQWDPLKEADYTAESWSVFAEAMENGKSLLAGTVSVADISRLEAAAEAIRLAALALEEKADPELEAAKKDAQTSLTSADAVIAKGKGNYTDDSWKAFTDAYTKLEAALKSSAPDTAVLKTLTAALDMAKAGLKEKAQNSTPDPKPQAPVKGAVYKVDGLRYKVTDLNKKTVTLTGTENKKLTSLTVKKSVKILGVTFKVTAVGAKAFVNCKKLKKVTIGANVTTIGKQAFSGCRKLKSIKVGSKKIKSVGKNALKGIDKKAVIRVPSSKKKKYKNIFAKRGQAGTVKIK